VGGLEAVLLLSRVPRPPRWTDAPRRLEGDIFGSTDPERIAAAVDAYCRRHLGVPVAAFAFAASSVGSVHGLQLADGRRVVVKAYRADVDVLHLRAVQAVQSSLADGGYPAPRPLAAPEPIGSGVAIVESLVDDGALLNGRDPAGRALIAASLAELVERCRPLAGLADLGRLGRRADKLWREPHDRRFDFPGTKDGAGWIDALAAEARRELDGAAGEVVVGHTDWRVEHLRFAGGRLRAVYDWDSVAVGPEPRFVGAVAHAFTADWSAPETWLPTVEESLSFVDHYEAARGRVFSAAERRTAIVALAAALAYGARCEHSDALTNFGTCRPRPAPRAVPRHSFRGVLAVSGAGLLGVSQPPGVPDVADD
jgi:Phosphotransferase enzyme family